MKHLFKAKKLGWKEEEEGVWFDASKFTKKQAEAQFKPYKGITDRGYPYTGYEFDGQKYHDYKYIGKFEDDKLPKNDNDIFNYLLSKFKKHH